MKNGSFAYWILPAYFPLNHSQTWCDSQQTHLWLADCWNLHCLLPTLVITTMRLKHSRHTVAMFYMAHPDPIYPSRIKHSSGKTLGGTGSESLVSSRRFFAEFSSNSWNQTTYFQKKLQVYIYIYIIYIYIYLFFSIPLVIFEGQLV